MYLPNKRKAFSFAYHNIITIKMCELCTRHENEELEKADKALRLNGFGDSYSYDSPISSYNSNLKLLSASAIARKPTLWIKRLGFTGHSPYNIKLRMASSSMKCPEELKKERESAEKAMNLNIGF